MNLIFILILGFESIGVFIEFKISLSRPINPELNPANQSISETLMSQHLVTNMSLNKSARGGGAGRPYGRPGQGRSTPRSTLWSTWPGREVSRLACLTPKFEFSEICFEFSETSNGNNFFIRCPIHSNSDSISTRIPRRTQWHNPFPLILTSEINYSLITKH